jgi:hypothetical protein
MLTVLILFVSNFAMRITEKQGEERLTSSALRTESKQAGLPANVEGGSLSFMLAKQTDGYMSLSLAKRGSKCTFFVKPALVCFKGIDSLYFHKVMKNRTGKS